MMQAILQELTASITSKVTINGGTEMCTLLLLFVLLVVLLENVTGQLTIIYIVKFFSHN